MNRIKQEPRVVIIGAGVGGLTYAIALKRQFGFENFTIYEKADEVGGCWRANTYPGCSSDVEIHWYSLSSDLNPNWNKSHGLQPEIQEYWIGLSKKYQLYPHLAFNTKVISAEWNSSANHYNLLVEDIPTGKRTTSTAEILISAVGVLEMPNIPYEMSGIQKFEGISFHSAEWPRGLDLRHKRVAVVGNASSGAQFVPSISADPSVNVVNFIRTPVWFNTRLHTPYSDTEKWIFANIPFAMRLHRAYIMFKFDWPSIKPQSEAERESHRQALRQYILDTTPSKYHGHLVPTHPPGCKRTVANSGYLASLSRPNLTLNFDGIAEIVKNGIVTKTGDLLPFDVIIYATGFKGDKYPVHVTGLHGTTVQGYYDAHGGPTAYYGTAIPNIPNFYMLAGPNTGTPTSTLFVEEVQVTYSLQLVKPVLDGLVSSFTAKADATDAYNAKLQERISRSVHTQCYSWQRTGGTGKVFNPFPWPVTLWWWWLRQPNWAHYNVTGADKWVRRRSENIRYALKALVPAFLFGVYVRRTTFIAAVYEKVMKFRTLIIRA
ncbi:FAD/NAD(P)-binding domain-containing protein [Paxillus ammoniavirescens]|nr:FAD/NAD(P)-binding domain-containing protein [Paxillus ammoniavirescens]